MKIKHFRYKVPKMSLNDRKFLLTSWVWLLVLSVFLWNAQAEDHQEIVVTEQGQVRGTHQSSPSGTVTAFLGIPYAEPPIGALRFKKPVPVKPWEGILDATKYGKSCIQNKDDVFPGFVGSEMWNANTEISEDCLQLNIWVPTPKPKDAPVLVYIHGGGFETGTSTLDVYDGRILAQTEGIIVVSINYRLGVLGFVAFPGNLETAGNAGLFDQQLALQWVQKNIAAFGGDPASVTLFGQSAGGSSVNYHMLAPSSYPLFKRGIIQSASATCPGVYLSQSKAWDKSFKLAKALGCTQTNTTEVVACLQTKTADELSKQQMFTVSGEGFEITRFVPTIDGDFLTDAPESLISSGKFKKVEVLAGYTKDEGTVFPIYGSPGFQKDKESLITREQFEAGVKWFFLEAGSLAWDSIILQYTDWADENNPVKNRDTLDDVLADFYFVCPISALAKHMSDHGHDVYVYLYDHRSTQDAWPEWAGVMHSAELPFLFGEPLDHRKKYTKAEEDLSRKMMRYWATFARTGNPIPAGDGENKWPKFDRETQKFVTLNTGPLQVLEKYRVQLCKFWDFYFPKVLKATEAGGQCLKKEAYCADSKSIPHTVEEIVGMHSHTP